MDALQPCAALFHPGAAVACDRHSQGTSFGLVELIWATQVAHTWITMLKHPPEDVDLIGHQILVMDHQGLRHNRGLKQPLKMIPVESGSLDQGLGLQQIRQRSMLKGGHDAQIVCPAATGKMIRSDCCPPVPA
jgi:hypothetical protein